MAKFAIVAAIKTAPGKRNEYLTHLKAHGQRCLATEQARCYGMTGFSARISAKVSFATSSASRTRGAPT